MHSCKLNIHYNLITFFFDTLRKDLKKFKPYCISGGVIFSVWI